MYRFDWIEQIKLRLSSSPSASSIARVSPVVWGLGFTSLLTDISTEMVSSVLPVYLVLHLHASPMQFGVIDGLYNGLGIALLSIGAGVVADRWRRHKEVAAFGYGLSALCKIALFASSTLAWIGLVIGLDRAGKGMRAAPRDALISLNTPRDSLAIAFAVHRALDAGGALLGPLLGFAILAQFPASFDVMWATSFAFAIFGLTVLWLFVPRAPAPAPSSPSTLRPSLRGALGLLRTPRHRALALCALLLSLATISDGFIYLLLQKRTGAPAQLMPLFYVGTAVCYMLFSLPVGLLADRWGRTRVLMAGYAVLPVIYVALLTGPVFGGFDVLVGVMLMGLYYAATEGLLMAMGSAHLPAELRTSGLALLGTAIGFGKMGSSMLFGWLWGSGGSTFAILFFSSALLGAVVAAAVLLRGYSKEPSHV